MSDPTYEALSRVLRIDWEQADREAREGSQIVLLREYLRRSALWAQALGAEAEWPLWSVADRFAARSAPVNDALSTIDTETNEAALGHLPDGPKDLCLWFVAWSAIEALDDVRGLALPAPYEPAILALERGGLFEVEARTFQLGGAPVAFGEVAVRASEPTITALDAETLARWDEAWVKAARQR